MNDGVTASGRASGAEAAGARARALPARLAPLGRLPSPAGWRTPMQSASWLLASFTVLYLPEAAVLIEVPGGLAPFVALPGPVPTLALASTRDLGEPIEPLVVDAAAAQRLADRLVALKRPLRFGHIPADGPFTRAFLGAAKGHGRVMRTPTGGSPVLRLDASWQDPLSRFSARRRADFRRMRRRAEAIGPVTTELLAPGPDQVAALLTRAVEIEAHSWKSRSHTAIADLPRQAAFLREYCTLAAAEGRLRLAFLRIGNHDAAMQIMVEEDGALWLLKIGYDEDFARASPGMLLLLDVVRDAARAGLERIEFLGKEADWTRFWTTEIRPHIRLRYYPRGLIGRAAMLRDGVEVGWRRLRDRRAGLAK